MRLPSGDASGRGRAALRCSVENGLSRADGDRSPLAETWKGSQAGRISGPRSFLPRLHRESSSASASALSARLRARWKESAQHATSDSRARGGTQSNVTLARCKCVVPHAISWSNGPWSRGSRSHRAPTGPLARARTNREFFLLLCVCLPVDRREKNRTIIEPANRRRRDSHGGSDERAKCRNRYRMHGAKERYAYM